MLGSKAGSWRSRDYTLLMKRGRKGESQTKKRESGIRIWSAVNLSNAEVTFVQYKNAKIFAVVKDSQKSLAMLETKTFY